MPTSQSVRGIVNGHWEPSPPQPPRALRLVRTSVAKLLKKLSDTVEPEKARTDREHHEPVAAE
jgi:hypothetical protein